MTALRDSAAGGGFALCGGQRGFVWELMSDQVTPLGFSEQGVSLLLRTKGRWTFFVGRKLIKFPSCT